MSSFTHESLSPQRPERGMLGRPSFSSHKTSDRLREAERRPSLSRTNIKPLRRSVFKEEGLDDLNSSVYHATETSMPGTEIANTQGRNSTFDDILKDLDQENGQDSKNSGNSPWYRKIGKGQRPLIKSAASAPPGSISTIPRIALIAFLIALVVPGFRYGGGKEKINGADAGVIMKAELVENGSTIEGRQNSPTAICTRWSHQSKLVVKIISMIGELTTSQRRMSMEPYTYMADGQLQKVGNLQIHGVSPYSSV